VEEIFECCAGDNAMSRTRWAVLAAISVGVASSIVPVYSIMLRMKAESLIRNASIVSQHIGEATSLSTLQAIYRRRLTQMPGCTSADCGYEVVESNRVLAVLHWAPYSELRSEIWFQDGKLRATFLDFASSANPHHSIVSHVYIQEGEGLEFDLDPWEETSPADTNGIVGVSPESLKVHEKTVLGFDLNCLTNHRGCMSVAELLPTVWEQRKDGKIRCRLQNHEGFIEGPW
jgi:hypothetical protein